MIVVPTQISGRQVDPTGQYRCPLCEVQSAGDSEDPGWVRCPMLDGKMICFGSCVEFQKVARSEDLDSHYDRGLMLELSSSVGRSVTALRSTCVQHQIDVASEQIVEGFSDNRLRVLRADLISTLAGLKRREG